MTDKNDLMVTSILKRSMSRIIAGALILFGIFGSYTAFAQASVADTTPRAMPAASAILPDEALGPDDLVEIMVSYCPELSRSFRIGSDGMLALPLIPQKLMVSGLTPGQLTTALQQALVHNGVMADPTVNVSVLEYRSRPVSVSGAVKSPVTFQATGQTTLLDAIAKAGGVNPTAGGTVIITTKSSASDGTSREEVQTISMKLLLAGNDRKLNVMLHGGEEIRIPEGSKIFVTGDVRRPGMYAMQGDEQTTILKAIALSEGLDSFTASEAYIYRRRDAGEDRQEIKVPLHQIMNRKSADVVLVADDILYIPTSNGKRMTSKVLSQLAGFGQSAGSGLLIYR